MSAVAATDLSRRSQALQPLAANAMKITGADGVAIALQSGDQIVCAASAGTAPQLGSKVDVSSTWSVRCMRERQPVSFSHAADGERGSYSVVLVPMLLGDRVIGFCGAFATRCDAFTPVHIQVLKKIAETAARNVASPTMPVERAEFHPASATREAPKLSSEQVKEIEAEIAAFAAIQKRHDRFAVAAKSTIATLLVIVASACVFPDRVQEWSRPIMYKISHTIQNFSAAGTHQAQSAAASTTTAPAYARSN